ncbi:MAG: GntR family transcriptional regulator [Bacteroidales bacterium]|nr:GntR family transcriptional regulator [Bacteroidales bacterium]
MFIESIDIQGKTKLSRLIDSISQSINQGIYSIGDPLPSVNMVSSRFGVSRDTVFKAYSQLKQRGLIGSTPAKGYYVTDPNKKVFIFLDSFSPFKDDLYNSIIKNLPSGYKVDLGFHHYNPRVFETVLLDSIGRYNMFVVMNFNNEKISGILRKIDPGRLLILDWGKLKDAKLSYVCQDFGEQPYHCFRQAAASIKKYRRFNYVCPEGCYHPDTTWDFFKKFCREENINYRFVKDITTDSVGVGEAYLVFRQKDLIQILKFARGQKLKIGKDTGIIAYNDTPLYEVVEEGITAISTDFRMMGAKAAEFIVKREKMQEIIGTKLILRNSL